MNKEENPYKEVERENFGEIKEQEERDNENKE